MPKFMCALFSLIVLLIAANCSNDKAMPAEYHVSALPQPNDVQVTINDGVTAVSWQIGVSEKVTGFVVTFTDEFGIDRDRSVADPAARSFEDDGSLSLQSGAGYVVRVRAVDSHDFWGRPSEPLTLNVP